MPHSMAFSEQKNKWFSLMIFAGLPFIIFFKIIKKELPPLSEVGPEKK